MMSFHTELEQTTLKFVWKHKTLNIWNNSEGKKKKRRIKLEALHDMIQIVL